MEGLIPSKCGTGSKRIPSDIVIPSKCGMGSKRNPSDIVIPSKRGGGMDTKRIPSDIARIYLIKFPIFFLVLPNRQS